MKNILVLGGSYFAGRVFVEALLKAKNHNVFVFNRGRAPLKYKGLTEIVGDRNDPERIRAAIPNISWHAVVDFCAYTPLDIERVLGSLTGVVEHYVFISTTTVCRETWDLPIKEFSPKLVGPQPELGEYSDYGYNKWQSECKLKGDCEKLNIPYTTLRPSIIYGRYNYAPRESYFFDLIRDNKPVIIPDNELALFSFIWVVDMARIIMKCLGNDKVFNQAFNLAAKELISYRRLVEVLELITGKKLKTIKLGIDEINRRRIPLPFPIDTHLIYSSAKIKQALGFQCTPFLDGMRDTYTYYQWVQKMRKW